MNNEEILRRLRELISLFYEEDEGIARNFKKAIMGKPHQDEVDDMAALFDFLETAISDVFHNFESCGRELYDCEGNIEELKEEFEVLFQENVRLKKRLAKRRNT